ncbi:uncharacterized protein LOC132731019 [Ruditapes philippinarum]|uniref:uncharacterized protein LOC132731019 n=1 Tax=Ruditapes philippinarum TaxID=129788 RepID=UPI00295C16A4|nr:uncharacterized protein LOC132731019 [Ruditapes philippinarum]
MIWQRLVITTLLTICARLNLTTGGHISIQKPGKQTGEMSYECGRNVTLTCNFKKCTFAILWMCATDVIPIAKCIQHKCFLTPAYKGQYAFTYDIQGIFNLTVIEITKEDNGRKLICSDGSDSDSEVIKVTDYEPLLFEDTINGTIRATSGCISQETEVSFKWIKMSVSSGIEEEITPTIHDNYTRRCSNDSDCGYDQQVQYTEMISAKSSDNGKYFLKVLAVYGNESKESCNTAYKYSFEEHGRICFTYSHNFVTQKLLIYLIKCLISKFTYYYNERMLDIVSIIGLIVTAGSLVLIILVSVNLVLKQRANIKLLAQQDNSRIGKSEEERETTTDPQKRVKDLDQKSSPEHDTSTNPLLAQQVYSRIKPEEEKETTTNPQKRVKDLDQKSSPEHDTSTKPLLAEQDNSRIGKPEEERETTTNPNKDKLLPNEKDMERSKKIFENRRHTH